MLLTTYPALRPEARHTLFRAFKTLLLASAVAFTAHANASTPFLELSCNNPIDFYPSPFSSRPATSAKFAGHVVSQDGGEMVLQFSRDFRYSSWQFYLTLGQANTVTGSLRDKEGTNKEEIAFAFRYEGQQVPMTQKFQVDFKRQTLSCELQFFVEPKAKVSVAELIKQIEATSETALAASGFGQSDQERELSEQLAKERKAREEMQRLLSSLSTERERDRQERTKAEQAKKEAEKLLQQAEAARQAQAQAQSQLQAQLQQAQLQAQQTPAAAPRGSRQTTKSVKALVIGNSAYKDSPLANPMNDAKAMAERLKTYGFNVQLLLDADRRTMVSALSKFQADSDKFDVNMLFYAGHGLQFNGQNYIVPTDMQLSGGQAAIEFESIPVSQVVDRYMLAQTKLVFLDACRDNPLSRSLASKTRSAGGAASSGLAPMEVASGTLISFATKDGSVALDGTGKNSPYTQALLKHLDVGEDISLVLRRVRQEVIKTTNGQQVPWDYGSLVGGELVISNK